MSERSKASQAVVYRDSDGNLVWDSLPPGADFQKLTAERARQGFTVIVTTTQEEAIKLVSGAGRTSPEDSSWKR